MLLCISCKNEIKTGNYLNDIYSSTKSLNLCNLTQFKWDSVNINYVENSTARDRKFSTDFHFYHEKKIVYQESIDMLAITSRIKKISYLRSETNFKILWDKSYTIGAIIKCDTCD